MLRREAERTLVTSIMNMAVTIRRSHFEKAWTKEVLPFRKNGRDKTERRTKN